MAKLILNGSTSGSITLESPAVSGTNTLTLPASTGTVLLKDSNNIVSVSGVQFPATQSASADANCLDDYEEGTWTPGYTLDGGSVSSVTSSGAYIKIGRQVTLILYISFGSSSSGIINNITGYPFTAISASYQAVGSVRENSNTGNQWHWRANSNDTLGLLRRYDNNAAITSGMTFIGTLTYFTS